MIALWNQEIKEETTNQVLMVVRCGSHTVIKELLCITQADKKGA